MKERAPDVANVFWLPGETLYCLQCKGSILPLQLEDGNNLYSLYWSTNENRGAYQVDVAEENLPNFTRRNY